MTMLTGDSINTFRLMTLRAALRLELKGFKRRGRSASAILREELKTTLRKDELLEFVNKHIETLQESELNNANRL